MTEKLRLDIPILLPEVTDTADRCVDRLMSELRGREGVENAHVVPAQDGQAAQHSFRPRDSAAARIRELDTAAGAGISERFGHATRQLDIPHERRARTIAEKLRAMSGRPGRGSQRLRNRARRIRSVRRLGSVALPRTE